MCALSPRRPKYHLFLIFFSIIGKTIFAIYRMLTESSSLEIVKLFNRLGKRTFFVTVPSFVNNFSRFVLVLLAGLFLQNAITMGKPQHLQDNRGTEQRLSDQGSEPRKELNFRYKRQRPNRFKDISQLYPCSAETTPASSNTRDFKIRDATAVRRDRK